MCRSSEKRGVDKIAAMDEPRVNPPAGAWAAGHEPLAPTAGHGVVVGVSIALSVVLVASSSAVGGTGLVALLMLLLACGALVVPVAVIAMTWAHAGPRTRLLFAVACVAAVVVLGFAVAGIVPLATALLSA
jgi:hypothetical protein